MNSQLTKTLKIEPDPHDTSTDPFFAFQHWYPRIWDEWARDKDGAVPDDPFAEEEGSVEITGSRLIYIVPREFVDDVLPLSVKPAPGQIVRVFVGRLEIVTPATAKAVKTAIASNDEATLDKYRRFLEPILRFVKDEPTEATR